ARGTSGTYASESKQTLSNVIGVFVLLLPRHFAAKLKGVIATRPSSHVANQLILVNDIEALQRIEVGMGARKTDLRNDSSVVLRKHLGDRRGAWIITLEAATDHVRAD